MCQLVPSKNPTEQAKLVEAYARKATLDKVHEIKSCVGNGKTKESLTVFKRKLREIGEKYVSKQTSRGVFGSDKTDPQLLGMEDADKLLSEIMKAKDMSKYTSLAQQKQVPSRRSYSNQGAAEEKSYDDTRAWEGTTSRTNYRRGRAAADNDRRASEYKPLRGHLEASTRTASIAEPRANIRPNRTSEAANSNETSPRNRRSSSFMGLFSSKKSTTPENVTTIGEWTRTEDANGRTTYSKSNGSLGR